MKSTTVFLSGAAGVVAALATAYGCVSNQSGAPGSGADASLPGEDASILADGSLSDVATPGADVTTAPDSGSSDAGGGDAAVTCPVAGQVALVVGLTDAGAGQTTIYSIDVNPNNIYAAIFDTTAFNDLLLQLPRGGGPAETLLTGAFNLLQLSTDGTFIYASDEGNSRLERIPIDGGTAQVFSTPGSTSDYALVGSTLYAVGSYSTGANSEAVEVWTQPTTSTTGATVLASGFLDGGDGETLNQRIAYDNGFIAVSLPLATGGSIVQIPTDGGAPAPLVTGIIGPQAMTAAGGQVFWVTEDGVLHAIAETGGTETVLATDVSTVATAPVDTFYVLSDGVSVYYGARGGGGQSLVKKVPVGGGGGTVVGCFAPPATMGTPIVLDATFVYWSDGQTIWRAPK